MSAPTPWSVLNVEGDHDNSDDELDNAQDEDDSPESSILSPASKRAKKRQAAARNKRAKMEAKQQQQQPAQSAPTKSIPGMHQKPASSLSTLKAAAGAASAAVNGQSSQSSAKTNGASSSSASSSKGLPPPPTFVDDSASISGRLAADSTASGSSNGNLGDPFITTQQQRQSSTTPSSSSLQAPSSTTSAYVPQAASSTAGTDYAASASTETEDEHDASLLLDDDESSSEEEYEEEEEEEGDASLVEAEKANLAEPPTPKPAPPKAVLKAVDNAASAIKSGTTSALNAVAQNSAVPSAVQDLAISAKDSDILKPVDTSAAAPYGSDHDPSKKWKSVVTRTIWTLVMIAGFCALMTMGHVYLIMLVMFCQAAVFKEISALFDVAAKPIHTHHHHHNSHGKNGGEKAISPTRAARDARARAERERWSKVTSWYFFAATNYFLHGETIIYYFKHIVFVDAYFIPFARHHRFISFMLYVLGFVGFVTNLKRNQLRRQFGLFCWIHMSLLLIVVSSHFIVNNILEGIIWFWLPASLVVMNDIAAYVWGMLFGRTQLIKLSPKKTVEGFVGAAFTTVVFAYIWATIFMRYSYMICPATDLGTTAFSSVHCQPNDVFLWRHFVLPSEISRIISMVYPVEQIPWAPFQFHAIVMGIFASLVAPFGGFFASGFKRAFNVKDFGDSIPGHGGMTDRMDCQFLMGLFAYVYYSSIIRDNHVTVGQVMQTIVSSLNQQEQAELAKALAGYLAQQGIKWK